MSKEGVSKEKVLFNVNVKSRKVKFVYLEERLDGPEPVWALRL
jgi:hypothetical protein